MIGKKYSKFIMNNGAARCQKIQIAHDILLNVQMIQTIPNYILMYCIILGQLYYIYLHKGGKQIAEIPYKYSTFPPGGGYVTGFLYHKGRRMCSMRDGYRRYISFDAETALDQPDSACKQWKI